ncbi:11691_t:CDS:2, partial [Racocetra fulgida]
MASFNEYAFLAFQTFDEIIYEYLQSLSEKKRSKALITENMANEYLQILNNPKNTSIANPNICHQVKSNYSSQRIGEIVILMYKEKSSNNWKPVALKERLYYIIAEKHLAIGHGGARATYAEVSNKYHGIKRYRQNENEDLCWTVGLATIVYSMNLSICRATNKRPFELVFGHEPRGHCVLIDQLWSQGIRYEENIPDDVQIDDDDIQFDVNEDNVQTEYYDDEFNENMIHNLSQSENNNRDNMSFIMVMLEITENEIYILGCQYGRLNEHYSAIELVSVTGTFREYPELVVISEPCVSAHEAAIQQSSG